MNQNLMYQNSLGMVPSVLNIDSIPSVPKCNWYTKRNDCNKRGNAPNSKSGAHILGPS